MTHFCANKSYFYTLCRYDVEQLVTDNKVRCNVTICVTFRINTLALPHARAAASTNNSVQQKFRFPAKHVQLPDTCIVMCVCAYIYAGCLHAYGGLVWGLFTVVTASCGHSSRERMADLSVSWPHLLVRCTHHVLCR